MLERLRYVLILLLFALAGNLGDTSFQDAGGVQPSLDETVTACPPAAVRNYFSVALCSCSASIEAPGVQTDHKAVVRQRAAVCTAVDAAFGVRTAMRTYSRALHADPVAYYVYSLERILI
ncbi:hypothetical protein [Alistipes timonensis]|uniref:hypothetical protein n=1 Tax=Alistipes timonensis TaxID=1465754 RepID=UPI00242D7792|nr:hypothetical protein [Alistipes timonensis]